MAEGLMAGLKADGGHPLVTLAVKAYKQERTVREAIASAFAQTWPNLEILLSDDCSPDGTYAIMEEMAAGYRGPHRVRLNRNVPNLGIVGHDNRIWELAEGRFVGHVAGDDIAEPNRVERLAGTWVAGGGEVMLVHSAVMMVGPDGAELGFSRPPKESAVDPVLEKLVRTHRNGIGATAMYDRRLFETFGPIDPDCKVEDRPMFLRAALLGRIAYLDEPLVRYRTGGLSDFDAGSWGYQYMRGSRMRALDWTVHCDRAFLRDLARVDRPDLCELEAVCRDYVAQNEFEVELWRAGAAGRIGLFPEALRRSARTGDSLFVKQWLKHSLGAAYIRFYDWRHGPGWTAAHGTPTAATVTRFSWDD
jgi:glycosyltransferase involved in cell wall biosynthesis